MVTIKILLICSAGEHNRIDINKGAEAVIIGTVELLRGLFPDADFVTTVQLSDRLQQKLCCKVIRNREYLTRFYSLPGSLKSTMDLFRCLLWKTVHKYFKYSFKFLINSKNLKEYYDSDLIIHMGMDLYSDNFGAVSIFEHSMDILRGVALGKPVIIWAESAGPFKKRLTRWLVRLTLNKVSLITLREKFSEEHLKEIKVNKPPIYITADPAFLMNPAPQEHIDQLLINESIFKQNIHPIIGLTLSNTNSVRKSNKFILSKSIYTIIAYILPEALSIAVAKLAIRTKIYSVVETKQNNYIESIITLTEYLTDNYNATIILVPHIQNKGAFSNDKELHRLVLKHVKNKERIRLLETDYTAQELKGIIGQCEIFIGAKMHANIAALSQAIPTVAMAYSYKFQGIMEMLGQDKYVCNTNLPKDLVRIVNDVWNNRKEIKTELENKLPIIRNLANLNGEVVQRLLQENERLYIAPH